MLNFILRMENELKLQWLFILKTTLIVIRPNDLVPKYGWFMLLILYFETICHVRTHFYGPIGGLEKEGVLTGCLNLNYLAMLSKTMFSRNHVHDCMSITKIPSISVRNFPFACVFLQGRLEEGLDRQLGQR